MINVSWQTVGEKCQGKQLRFGSWSYDVVRRIRIGLGFTFAVVGLRLCHFGERRSSTLLFTIVIGHCRRLSHLPKI